MPDHIKAIIFDADGMVINMTKLFSDRLVSEYNCQPEAVQEFFTASLKNCVLGQADLKEELKLHIDKFGWTGSVDSLITKWFNSEDKPNKPLIKTIKALKKQNIRCYLATNQEKYRAQYMADEMGFLQLFDHLFISCEMHSKKPQQQFFAYIWDALSYMEGFDHKHEVMFWDDRPEYVKSASDFGFAAYPFESNRQFHALLAQNGITV